MPGDPTADPARFAQLLRRAHRIIRHHRYRRLPLDAREVVESTLAGEGQQFRGPLSEAVAAMVHDLR